MKKKTNDKDIWVYSAVGRTASGTSNVLGVCDALSEEETIGYAVKQLKKHEHEAIILIVNAFKLELED